jgi:hypothetical protein
MVCSILMRVDTLVDPVEMLPSSSRLPAAKATPPRGSMPSLDPDAQVQWFSREFPPNEAPSASIDVDVSWDEESDTAPTLVLRRRAH